MESTTRTAPAAEDARPTGLPPTGRRWRRRLVAALAIAGPGLIAANAGNDAGGIATYASAGAQFGYRTLFFMLLVTVGLVLVQEMCARLGAYTGVGLGALIREQFSIRVSAFALLCFAIANIGLVVSEFAGIAAGMQLLGVSRYISVPIAAAAIWGLVIFGSYRYAEKIFLVLSMAFLAYPIAAILAHPDWAEAGAQLALPHFVASKDFLLLGVALIGTTITPYMQFYVAAAVADRGIGPADYPRERVDTVVGSIFADVISIFIIIATAAAITTRAPLDSAAQAATALEPVAGRFAGQLFGLGLLGASALAAAVVPLSTSYAVAEAVGVESSVSRSFRQAPLFLGLFTGQIVLGAAIALIPGNLIELLVQAQVLNGIITPILLAYVLILANRRSVLGNAANGPVFRAIATACVVVVAALSATVLVQTILGWFGLG
ncbi:natural resistance-associated macrophage protein [Pseudonocardia dioxanivorans CB1190]|uniref:Natural resistance-associated macrophage protein n=1 Tax=Pseudonocardia dioxanivorans (strain ATCC 55486 / DSM 44775 / JCM 13855 / CB1190) TaxID=675635 RepID=F4CLX5_PSEUX|nr:divalent metal cation transporter [Pseudonocardia dioxanivorans]AEA22323.1 natural resistance-associated macrophage protein [Pseudonocardia dioxanivorans CB1190]